MLSLEDIKDRCIKNSALVGDNFNAVVKVNNRLTSTFGRCTHTGIGFDVIEISKSLLETCTDKSIYAVIDHEWSHYYTTKRTGHRHGHDKEFRKTCAMIGCTNNRPHFTPERCVSKEEIYKYSVYCQNCGEIAHYHRKGKVLKKLSACRCPQCRDTGSLYYKKNY